MEATIIRSDVSDTAILHYLSERGCYALSESRREVGQDIEIIMQGSRPRGYVVARSADGYHVSFTGDALLAVEVDRVSATTLTELMKLAKNHHVAFVRQVSDIVASGVVPPGGLTTARTCRLGRWYDRLTDATTLTLLEVGRLSGRAARLVSLS